MLTYYDTLIDTHTVFKHLKDPDWIIFDCRFLLSDPEEGRSAYLKSHIPGSYYVHLDEDLTGTIQPGITGRHPLPEPADFIKMMEGLGLRNNMQVVVLDHGTGGIAARLWWMLRWVDISKVAVLNGGWTAWNTTFPVETTIPEKRKSGKLDWKLREDRVVEAEFVNRIKFDAHYLLIDARDHQRYLGIEEPIDPIKGHVPGAINRPFKENLLENGLWKSKDALAARFMLQQTYLANKTIFYCGSGVTACHNILAFKHAGMGDALLYIGSWSHWITNQSREIATDEVIKN